MSGLRVLSADDHPVNLRYLELLLIGDGHQVHNCANGQLAVDAARARVFDVVLMDLHMPVMDGETAIRAIRALPAPHGGMRIIAITADTARQRLMDAGADRFLAKPVTPQALREAMTAPLAAPPAAPDAGAAAAAPATHTATAAGPAIIDAERLAEMRDMMPLEVLRSMLDEVIDAPAGTLASLLALLDQAARQDGVAAAPGAPAEAAHQLKSSAVMLGLDALQRAAGHTEKRLRDRALDAAMAAALATLLREQAERTRAALNAALSAP